MWKGTVPQSWGVRGLLSLSCMSLVSIVVIARDQSLICGKQGRPVVTASPEQVESFFQKRQTLLKRGKGSLCRYKEVKEDPSFFLGHDKGL